ncbi:MAG TPA: hypothetical protein VFZ09_13205 [Archangium sp.]|uniref:hypothetical protein n=1 Tax=Archangium sp. TaxID=1872627 RepID=UPI002E3258EC|nr:hypothetical protein [Archangium sp.]HEX5747194.1 hypothetical protein [Archangium sp.]
MRSFLVLALAGATALTACRASVESPPVPTEPQVSRHPERRGISLLAVSGPRTLAEPGEDIVVEPRRSLAVTDEVILARFRFEEVMNRLAEQSGIPGLTGLRLYQEWWDSQRKAPGLGLGGPHCDDEQLPDGKPIFNSYPYSCPREEWKQALENPFLEPATNPAAYVPIGLFNRFDLAAQDGSDCGEYRIVFARRSGMTEARQRNLIAFEGVLPNPKPKKGLEGCRKVARFWAELSQEPDPAARAEALHRFYFEGVGKFPPVIHPDHLGNATEQATGQVRTNQFIQSSVQGTWTLREFRLRKRCTGDSCVMRFEPDTVKTNPAGVLFSTKQEHPLKEAFSESLVSQVETLAGNELLRYRLDVDDRFNSGQSHANGTENLYAHQMGKGDSPLRRKLQKRLEELGSPLTVDNIVARVQTLSCAGCHQLSTKADLGGGLTWPSKTTLFTFVHVSERTTDVGPDGPRFGLSEALVGTFLPPRQQLLEAFLARRPPFDKHPDPDDECKEPEVRGARADKPGKDKPDKDRCEDEVD